jgi:hypothetical protein
MLLSPHAVPPQALTDAQALAMRTFLDDERWGAWQKDMEALVEGLQLVKNNLEQRAAAERDRPTKIQKTIGQPLDSTDVSAPMYREATDAVKEKYTALDLQLSSLQPYHPLSLTPFEPIVRTERYEWLKGLNLSFPIAILRADVGGNIGTLAWALRRDDSATDELTLLDDARQLIEPLIPQLHNRAIKGQFRNRVLGLMSMPKSVTDFIFKELTGDQSSAESMEKEERLAFVERQVKLAETFTLAVGETDLVLDIRAITNAARVDQTAFSAFWECTLEILNAMNTAAEERRHGGVVAFLSELISHKELFERAVARLEAKKASIPPTVSLDADACSLSWFQYQFWPANEYVAAALNYTGRFPLRLHLQVRNLRKEHAQSRRSWWKILSSSTESSVQPCSQMTKPISASESQALLSPCWQSRSRRSAQASVPARSLRDKRTSTRTSVPSIMMLAQ